MRLYTGDDFNFAELIAGDGQGSEPTHGHSDALLGIFDAIAPAASAAGTVRDEVWTEDGALKGAADWVLEGTRVVNNHADEMGGGIKAWGEAASISNSCQLCSKHHAAKRHNHPTTHV